MAKGVNIITVIRPGLETPIETNLEHWTLDTIKQHMGHTPDLPMIVGTTSGRNVLINPRHIVEVWERV